ncbi:hypothetical protein ABW19_dt0201751 [Dactylella cylindrospora]|nr:hypothetical protein ABW19_dt0201751 [Dactylella cylindrospora]
MEFEWTCCRCRQSNSTCTRCSCNHSYCNICANCVPRCTSQPPMDTSAYSPFNNCGFTSSGGSSPVLGYASLQHDAIRPRSTPHPLGVLHSTHPANQLSLIAPFYDSAPPTSVPSPMMGTMTTISSSGGSTSRRKHLIRPRLSISQFKGMWSSNSSSCDDSQSDDENFGKTSSMSRVDKWWMQL